jgi:Family of unknown function (DUF6101)
LRRQAKGGGPAPARSSRALRLDPFSLPLRFSAGDVGADERTRDVELHRERVIVRRRVRGIAMTLDLRVADFLGVSLRVIRRGKVETVCLTLEHRDPDLSVTLYRSGNSDDVVAEWQSWAQILQRPLLVADDSGALHELFPRLGPLRLGAVAPRRRRRTAMKGRRPSIGWRRRQMVASGVVHRGEREMTRRD